MGKATNVQIRDDTGLIRGHCYSGSQLAIEAVATDALHEWLQEMSEFLSKSENINYRELTIRLEG